MLGPLFFSIYINDFPYEHSCSTKLFADDTSPFSVVKEVSEAATKRIKQLENIINNLQMGLSVKSVL